MTPNGVTRVNRLRRANYATSRRPPSRKQAESTEVPPPAPSPPSAAPASSVPSDDTKDHDRPDRESAPPPTAGHVVPSEKYAPVQRRKFRAIWKVLHAAAAARSFGVMSEAQFQLTLKIACDRLQSVCIACYREFVLQVPTLARTPPGEIERAMYSLHDSTTVQSSPPFDEIKFVYRAHIADIVMRSIVRP